jgi:peptidoglycan/LPS O-acetylase OafA/YrhL
MTKTKATAPTPRNAAIDLLRALSILWIVGVWHLLGYTDAIDGYKNDATHRLTVLVLGLFMLIAGHLIGRAGIHGMADVVGFYRRRLLRIYPPYLLALIGFSLSGLLEPGQLLPAALLASSFGSDPPGTLWYIGVLVVFYVLAPLLLLLSERIGGRLPALSGTAAGVITAAVLIAASTALARFVPGWDPRMFLYFPAFAVGLLVTARLEPERLRPGSVLLVLALGAAGLVESMGHNAGRLDNGPIGIPLATLMPMAVLILTQRALPRLRLPAPLMVVSTASYFMYLFHRLLYHWLLDWAPAPLTGNPWHRLLYLALFCLPLIVLVCWRGQLAYERLVAGLISRSSFSSSR